MNENTKRALGLMSYTPVAIDCQTIFDYREGLDPRSEFDVRKDFPCVKPPFDFMAICGRSQGMDQMYVIEQEGNEFQMALMASRGKSDPWRQVVKSSVLINRDGSVDDIMAQWVNEPENPWRAGPGSFLTVALMSLSFMHVKGARVEKVSSSIPAIGKRKTIQEYHVLRIEPVERIVSQHRSDTERGVRAHIVRGHFKDYRESGLGKNAARGIYWWQPHVRGNKKIGIVAKSYETGDVS